MSEQSLAGFDSIYASDMTIWHNHDGKTQNRHENLQLLGEIFKLFKHLEYLNVRRELTESGYVQQHIFAGEVLDGRRFEMPCVHITRVRDGKVLHIDEYFDPAPLYAVLGKPGGA